MRLTVAAANRWSRSARAGNGGTARREATRRRRPSGLAPAEQPAGSAGGGGRPTKGNTGPVTGYSMQIILINSF